MKEEAIRALELFKQQHLARPAVEVNNEQADTVSESSQPTKESVMLSKERSDFINSLRYPQPTTEATPVVPKRQKGVNFNYPDHYKPLKDRIMSALNNGARTAEAVATYCKEPVKLINMQLGRWVSRGQVGRKVSSTGIIRYYPFELAKEMGILEEPKPINYYTKERRAEEKKRSSSVPTQEPVQTKQTFAPTNAKEAQYIEFLEKRITEWQTEARRMAKQITELEGEVVKAKSEPRNVTGEVQEVMKEVTELRSTVAYLESKLFGRK